VISTELIASRIENLPTLPVAVSQLIRLTASNETSLNDFEKVIRPDPALTANILKTANSVAYRGVREITNVKDAVGRLGMRGVFDVAAGYAFAKVLPDRLPGYEVDAHSFWQHSVAVAVFCQKLLKNSLGGQAPDLAFTAGLLHDLGKLVICFFLEEKASEVQSVLDMGKLTYVNAERKALGTDHAEVGIAVARKWSLPHAVGIAARWHHQPDQAPDADRQLANGVHVANCLAHTFGFGADVGELHRSIQPSAMSELRLTVKDLERIASESLGEIYDLSAALASAKGAHQ
jgi:putative nucleotidyltransferase with HDIG domain